MKNRKYSEIEADQLSLATAGTGEEMTMMDAAMPNNTGIRNNSANAPPIPAPRDTSIKPAVKNTQDSGK